MSSVQDQKIRNTGLVINILGNSQAQPNLKNNLVYEDTYSYKIFRQMNIDCVVINTAKRNNTVVNQAVSSNIDDDILSFNADYHIMQFGIVDCPPRLFTERENKLLNYCPARKIIIRFMSKHRYFFTKIFPKVYVKKDIFREKYIFLVQTILTRTKTKKIFLINISATQDRNKQRSFRIDDNIKQYNLIIKEIANTNPDKIVLIDLYSMTSKDLSLVAADGIHLALPAHALLAKMIGQKIRDLELP
jgi:hypothetical protein